MEDKNSAFPLGFIQNWSKQSDWGLKLVTSMSHSITLTTTPRKFCSVVRIYMTNLKSTTINLAVHTFLFCSSNYWKKRSECYPGLSCYVLISSLSYHFNEVSNYLVDWNEADIFPIRKTEISAFNYVLWILQTYCTKNRYNWTIVTEIVLHSRVRQYIKSTHSVLWYTRRFIKTAHLNKSKLK